MARYSGGCPTGTGRTGGAAAGSGGAAAGFGAWLAAEPRPALQRAAKPALVWALKPALPRAVQPALQLAVMPALLWVAKPALQLAVMRESHSAGPLESPDATPNE